MSEDAFSDYYSEFLDGTYDCIDRIVLNAYNPFLHSGGGFRTWWRQLNGTDDNLDDTHLMRFAGHFSRRVKAFAAKNRIPLVFCDSDTRKGERVLRFEAIVHNAGRLKCGRCIARFGQIAVMLREILYRFMSQLHCVDVCCIDANALQSWAVPSVNEGQRTAGIDITNPRIRAVMQSLIALSIDPSGITTPKLAEAVRERTGEQQYQTRHAAYDLRKFRAKAIVAKLAHQRSYGISSEGLRAMTAYLTINDKVLIPLINQACRPKRGRPPTDPRDIHYRNMQTELGQLFELLKIAA